MNEKWAKDAIKDGAYTFPEVGTFNIIKEPKGQCTGCYFLGKQCPPGSVTICTTGGVIFKKI